MGFAASPPAFEFDEDHVDESPWFGAAHNGSLDGLKEVVKCGVPFPDPFFNEDGNSLFHILATVGDVESYKYIKNLLQESNGVSKNYKPANNKGETPWLLAASHGHLPLASYLFSHSNINEKDQKGWTALLRAIRGNHLEMVKFLIENGASVDDCSFAGGTAILAASFTGNLEIFQFLLSIGAKLDETDKYGRSCLLVASDGGHLELVTYLVSLNCSINENSADGSTCLLRASLNGHLDVVKYLLSQGASLTSQMSSSCLVAAAQGGSLETVRYLVSQGCTLDEVDHYGKSSLFWAANSGHSSIVQYLISGGAKQDFHLFELGFTPSFEVLEILVNEGFINTEDIAENSEKPHFLGFMKEMARKKNTKRAAPSAE